jgi:hypothetical protein
MKVDIKNCIKNIKFRQCIYKPTTVITSNLAGPVILFLSISSSVGKIKVGRAVRYYYYYYYYYCSG